MQLLTIISATLLVGANALALDTPNPVHLLDFRGFTGNDCKTGNTGIYTVYNDQVQSGACNQYDVALESIILNDINPGCNYTVFETADCSDTPVLLEPGACYVDNNRILAWLIKFQE